LNTFTTSAPLQHGDNVIDTVYNEIAIWMGIDLDDYSSVNYEVSFKILTYNHFFIYASMVLELTDFI
jgi:hypothetical protein